MRGDSEYYGSGRPGQFWLSLPCGKKSVPVRIQVPAVEKPGKGLPVVLPLHSAGGSENTFFDVHGNGLLARLFSERG